MNMNVYSASVYQRKSGYSNLCHLINNPHEDSMEERPLSSRKLTLGAIMFLESFRIA